MGEKGDWGKMVRRRGRSGGEWDCERKKREMLSEREDEWGQRWGMKRRWQTAPRTCAQSVASRGADDETSAGSESSPGGGASGWRGEAKNAGSGIR